MNHWVPRLLALAACLLALVAAVAWGGVLGKGLGVTALVAAFVCAGAAFVMRLLRPSPARWQRLHLGIAVGLMAVGLLTLAVDPENVGPSPCGEEAGDDPSGFCVRRYSFMAILVMPATILAAAFAWMGMWETPTPRA